MASKSGLRTGGGMLAIHRADVLPAAGGVFAPAARGGASAPIRRSSPAAAAMLNTSSIDPAAAGRGSAIEYRPDPAGVASSGSASPIVTFNVAPSTGSLVA